MSSSSSTTIDMSLIPANSPSLCIPRVFSNITKERVAFVIKSVNLGEIDHIDMVPKSSENGDKFQRVFIHLKQWGTSSEAVRARERVLSGKEIKIVYDEPWFWKISANRSTHRFNANVNGDKPRSKNVGGGRPRPHIVEESSSSDNDEELRNKKFSSQREHKPLPNPNSEPKNNANAAGAFPPLDVSDMPVMNYGDVGSSKPKKRSSKKPHVQLKKEEEK